MPTESAVQRKLAGPMAVWGVNELLLRQILFALHGANWQRGGGKGSKPKPIALPDQRQPGSTAGADVAQRLKNLGLFTPLTAS